MGVDGYGGVIVGGGARGRGDSHQRRRVSLTVCKIKESNDARLLPFGMLRAGGLFICTGPVRPVRRTTPTVQRARPRPHCAGPPPSPTRLLPTHVRSAPERPFPATPKHLHRLPEPGYTNETTPPQPRSPPPPPPPPSSARMEIRSGDFAIGPVS